MTLTSKTLIVILALFSHPKNSWDNNSAIGIQKELGKLLTQEGYQVKLEMMDDIDYTQFSEEPQDKAYIIIAAGSRHLQALTKTRKHMPNSLSLWIGHHDFSKLFHELPNLDIIVMPRHAITLNLRAKLNSHNTKIIETDGTPHNLNLEMAKAEYQKLKYIIAPGLSYSSVILGGDTTSPDGNVLAFTPEEARELGKIIGRQAQQNGNVILITNTKRTLDYMLRNGQDPESDIDDISKAFTEGLKARGLVQNHDFQFFDYRRKNTNSTYLMLLGAAASTPNGMVYAPGESMPMTTEICELFPFDRVNIYKTNAMAEIHKAYLDSSYSCGNIIDIHSSEIIRRKPMPTELFLIPTTKKSAKEIFNYLSEKYFHQNFAR